MADEVIRVLTYNLHNLKDDQRALARIIRTLRPDVLCAQEAPRRGLTRWRMRRLGRKIGLSWVCGGRNSAGNAIFIRPGVKVLQRTAHRLPVGWERTRTGIRGFVMAELDFGDQAVRVFGLHLGLHADQRARHLPRILRQIATTQSQPTIIAGDFNETPDGPCWAALAQGCGLAQVPVMAPTFTARNPRRALDALLLSPQFRVRQLEPVGPAHGLSRGDLIAASDHLPVLAIVDFAQEQLVQSPVRAQD